MPSYFIKTKWVHNLVTIYLITFISSCTTPPRSVKPPTSVARAMETRSFEGDLVTILKASINSLQDMDYTLDVLNSDIGLISASRTSERRKANLANENNNSEQMSAGEQACLVAGGFVAIVVLISFLDSIFDGDSSNDGDSSIWSGPATINNRDDEPDGPIIYRYKIMINLTELDNNQTRVRVSASGESEQDGKILATGGIHEIEFFSKFFAGMNQGLFLDKNTN